MALTWPAFFIQGAGFYFDNANLDICRFLSLEDNDSSIRNCVTAYAITFTSRQLFFFGVFLVILKKQEYYWDSFCVGVCLNLACNFILYVMTQFAVANVFVTSAVIALIVSMNFFVRFKRNKSLHEARKMVKDDADLYQEMWNAVSLGNALITNNESLIGLWKESPLHPVEVSGTKIQIRQDSKDFEFLYFLAEFGNEPFNDMITSWCSGKNDSGLSDGRQFFNEAANNGSTLFQSPPTVIRGPIKSVQRSIEKVYRCYRSDPSLLTDLVRCQVVFVELCDIDTFMKELRKAEECRFLDVLRIRNRFDKDYDATKNSGGFRDCCVKLRLYFIVHHQKGHAEFCRKPDDGAVCSAKVFSLICEVQLHVKAIHSLLEGDASKHKNYIFHRNQLAS